MYASLTTVRSFRDEDAQAFHDLNMAWIQKYFEVETKDREMLSDPQESIIDKGGRILIAELDGEAVGTVALIPMEGRGVLELAKMAVREGLRGHGIGQAIMEAAKAEAKDMGGTRIWIETHNSLEAAMKLYTSAGFRPLTGDDWQPTPYSRCNSQFMLDLGA